MPIRVPPNSFPGIKPRALYPKNVNERKRPRIWKWLLWSPFVLLVLGFAWALFFDIRVSAEINKELALLKKMGVNPSRITPNQDAFPTYSSIVAGMDNWQNPSYDASLERLEKLADGGKFIKFVTDDSGATSSAGMMQMTVLMFLDRASNKQDLDSFKKAYEIRQKLATLLEGSEWPWPHQISMRSARPATSQSLSNPKVRHFLREKLSQPPDNRLYVARLTRIGRSARYDDWKA